MPSTSLTAKRQEWSAMDCSTWRLAWQTHHSSSASCPSYRAFCPEQLALLTSRLALNEQVCALLQCEQPSPVLGSGESSHPSGKRFGRKSDEAVEDLLQTTSWCAAHMHTSRSHTRDRLVSSLGVQCT